MSRSGSDSVARCVAASPSNILVVPSLVSPAAMMRSITQKRGPFITTSSAPSSFASALASIASHTAGGQSFWPRVL